MAKFSLYNIPLLKLAPGKHIYEYELDNKYFEKIDGDEVKKGNVKVVVTVQKVASNYEFDFDLLGNVQVPCNRCLDDMNQPIESHNRLVVKLGEEYFEESDEIIIIPRDEGEINIAWFLYEFVALNIPIKHNHEPGKCNKTMSSKLRKHRAVSSDDPDDDDQIEEDDDVEIEEDIKETIDPRWEGLKGLNFEDN